MLEHHASHRGWGVYCLRDLRPHGCRYGRMYFGLSYWPRRCNIGSPFLGIQFIHGSLNTSRLEQAETQPSHIIVLVEKGLSMKTKVRIQVVALWILCKPCWSFLNTQSGKTSMLKKVLSCKKQWFCCSLLHQPLVLKLTLLPFCCKSGFFNHYSIKNRQEVSLFLLLRPNTLFSHSQFHQLLLNFTPGLFQGKSQAPFLGQHLETSQNVWIPSHKQHAGFIGCWSGHLGLTANFWCPTSKGNQCRENMEPLKCQGWALGHLVLLQLSQLLWWIHTMVAEQTSGANSNIPFWSLI